jgi:hypothetical protein
MNIYLTNHANVRHTKFCAADGQVLYQSETPGLLHTGKETTISKVVPNDDPEDMSMLIRFHCTPDRTHKILTSADKFADLATIKWRIVKSSTMIYDGVELPIATKGIFAQWDLIPSFYTVRVANS